MSEHQHIKTKQLNFNTVLLLLVGAVISVGVKKLDEGNTELVKLSAAQTFVGQRLDGVEKKLGEMVLHRDFEAEISRLDREVEALRRNQQGHP